MFRVTIDAGGLGSGIFINNLKTIILLLEIAILLMQVIR